MSKPKSFPKSFSDMIFLISGDFPEIGRAEVESLISSDKSKNISKSNDISKSKNIGKSKKSSKLKVLALDKQVLAVKSKSASDDLMSRLAYLKSAYIFLFKCRVDSSDSLLKKAAAFDWSSYYKGDFCVRKIVLSSGIHCQDFSGEISGRSLGEISGEISEKELAGRVWHSLEANGIAPKVKLIGSSMELTFIFYKRSVACGIKIFENTEDFQSRRPHLRPGFSPVSLQPRFARAMVNLTGIGSKELSQDGILYDPFCGTGGIMLEAALLGIKSKGSDNSASMYWKCMKNLRHYGITKSAELSRMDSTKIAHPMKFIATDLPYGRSSAPRCEKTLANTYAGFAKVLDKTLLPGGRAVICFSNFFDFMKLLKQANEKKDIKKVYEFNVRVHKSLSRRLVVLERKKHICSSRRALEEGSINNTHLFNL